MRKKLNSPWRKVSRMLVTFLILFANNFTLNAQAGYQCDPSCFGNVLNISTGYNQSTSGYNTPLFIESNWTLTAAPSGSGVTIPSPCWDIPSIFGWSNNPNATWVSPFQSPNYNINNWNGSTSNSEAFEFEKCFCVCHESTVNIDFDLLADDYVEVFLDGNLIGSGLAGSNHFQWANRVFVNDSYLLSPGQHCLTVKLYNVFGAYMGFSLEGAVTGADLLTSVCCNPEVKICGTKVKDSDCNGVVDLVNDQGLSGWTINLADNLGNNIGSAITDDHGNYCFVGLNAGTYVVNEVNQSGWTQSYPASPGTYTLVLNPGEMGTAIFGNCQDVSPPCSFDLSFDGTIVDCGISMAPIISGMPSGYHVVSYAWSFGDGSGSDNQYGIHYYSHVGHYTVCLMVTIFNGHECCTRTFCRNISIDRACSEGCTFEAYIGSALNPTNCEYSFSANVIYAGVPVTGWYWEFGDGSTATGPLADHTFSSPGTYNVCLTLFGSFDGRCCFYKICREVVVTCSTTHGHGKSLQQEPNVHTSTIDLANKNVVILNQNVPNPFAESTVIGYNIPTTFRKAELKFMNINGTVIKTVNITRTGKGEITVYADDLTSGMYIYSLIIDDKIIDSKRMVKN
jgi:hypothetical protein